MITIVDTPDDPGEVELTEAVLRVDYPDGCEWMEVMTTGQPRGQQEDQAAAMRSLDAPPCEGETARSVLTRTVKVTFGEWTVAGERVMVP